MHYLLGMLTYIWMAFCLSTIARRLHYERSYLAWIPVANLYLACRIANKPVSWVFYSLLPVLNILVLANIWSVIAVRCGKPPWFGLMVVVPVIGLLFALMLAYSNTIPEFEREEL